MGSGLAGVQHLYDCSNCRYADVYTNMRHGDIGRKVKILCLYKKIMDYTLATTRVLISADVEVHVVPKKRSSLLCFWRQRLMVCDFSRAPR
jgi:hypothetical protein